MISSVSNVSFKGDVAPNAELINAPSQFSTAPEIPADSFEKEGLGEEDKSSSVKKGLIGTALVALATFAGLGYAVKNGKISKVEIPAEGIFAKAKAYAQNAAHKVGSWAESCWNWAAGLFGKTEKAATTAENSTASADEQLANAINEAS